MFKKMAEYEYHYGLRVRIYPCTKQKQIITASSNASRFVYNKMVELGKEKAGFGHPKVYIKVVNDRLARIRELMYSTKLLKDIYPWLRDENVDTMALDNAKQRYKDAWNMYHQVGHIAPPRFHKKSYVEKYQTSEHYDKKKVTAPTMSNGRCRFSKNHVHLPLLGRIRFSGSPKVIAMLLAKKIVRIGTITITKDACGDYYASFQLASDTPFVEKFAKTGSKVGIDLNVENYYADSNGHVVDNPHHYRKEKERLAREKRVLSRRAERAKKEHRPLSKSKNYQKQRLKVAKLESRVMNRRTNFLHIQSTALIKNHDLVVAEELRSKNLMKNHALSMAIQDNGWRIFLNMLAYKAKLYGKAFVTVDPRYTTQTCSHCGHILKGEAKLTLKDREWTCPVCGIHHDRDINAAKNILAKGLAA